MGRSSEVTKIMVRVYRIKVADIKWIKRITSYSAIVAFLPQDWHISGATFHAVHFPVKLKEKLNIWSHVTQLS